MLRTFLSGPWSAVLALLTTRIVLFYQPAMALASEDAYITFRYARNLSEGHGLVFNLGERVMGYTSPLWTVALSLPFALGLDPVWFARTVLVGCDVATLLLFWRLLEGAHGVVPARLFGWFFALWVYWSGLAASCLEMSLAVALLAAAVTYWRWWWLAALALVRPEGALMAVVVACWSPRRERWLAAAAVLPVVLALWWFYGSPIPHSVTAKAATYGHPGPLAAQHWWAWMGGMHLPDQPGDLVIMEFIGGTAMLLTAGLLAAVPVLWRERRSALAAAVVASGAVWVSYALVGAAYFWWYLTLPLLSWSLMAAAGLSRVLRWPIYAASLAAIVCTWPTAMALFTGRAAAENQFALAAAEMRGGQSVMAEPVGIVGYETRLRVVDMVGLVSPAPKREPGWLGAMVRSRRPDWILLRASETDAKAFAGGMKPFLSERDRDDALSPYALVWMLSEVPGKPKGTDLIVLRRKRP